MSRPTLRTLAVLVLALAVLVAPAAAQTNSTVDEDFEDYAVGETAPGPWSITQSGGSTSAISDTSTLGTRSLLVQDSGDVATHTEATLNTSDLLVEATIRGDGQGGTLTVGSLSLDYDPNEFSNRLVLNDGSTEVIADSQGFTAGQWVNLKLEATTDEARAKVWAVGQPEPDTWNINLTDPAISEGQLSVSTSSSGDQLYVDAITAGSLTTTGGQISGTVVDQYGTPQPNVTVQATSVTDSALDTSAADLDAEAESLLADLADPLPDAFDRSLDPTVVFDDSDTYAAVHTRSQWDVDGQPIGDGETVTVAVTPDLDAPDVVLPAGDPLVVSVWDGGEESFAEDGVDGSLPGATTTGTVVLDQLGPTGQTLSTRELDTEPLLEYTAAANLGTKTHHAAIVTPAPGIYRVYPQDNEAAAYVVSVGDPDEQARVIEADLRNRADTLTARADRVRGLVADGGLSTVRTTTDENGTYAVDLPSGIRAAHLTAYDAPAIRSGAEPTLADLRDRFESGNFGSLTLAREPVVAEPPANGIEITVTTTDAPPWADPTAYEAQWTDQIESTLDAPLAGLQGRLVDRLDDLDDTDADELRAQLDGLRESNDRLADRLDDTEGDLQATLETLESLQETVDSGTPSTEIDEGLLDYEVPFDAPIPTDAVAATIRYANGSTDVVDSEYLTVEQSGFGDESAVRIEDFPIPDGAVAPQVRLQVAGSEGIGRASSRLTNPAVEADLPQVNALSVSTLRPGPDEQVSVGLDAESGTGYGGLVRGEAYAPDGAALNVTVDEATDRLRFETAGQGVHFVRAIYETQDGRTVAESVRLRAGETSQQTPPTVRATDGVAGPLAVVSGGLESGSITETDGRLAIEATVDAGESAPGLVHLYPDGATSGSVDGLSVSVVRGADGERVQEHVGLRVHLSDVSDEALLWRGDEPITPDGETRFGDLTDRGEKAVLRSYTQSDGTAELRVDHAPGVVERVRHWVGVVSPIG